MVTAKRVAGSTMVKKENVPLRLYASHRHNVQLQLGNLGHESCRIRKRSQRGLVSTDLLKEIVSCAQTL